MTLQIGFLALLLVVMVVLFLTERIPVDLTAFLGLMVLVFGGYLSPTEAFTGFSSPAVITMLAVFIVGAALLDTGVADLVGDRIHRIVGDNETRLVVIVMVVVALLSAFMSNTAATVVLMPAVATLARHAGVAPSRLFMPLAFGAILGGTTTLVGTAPNILASQMLEERGLEPFELFDFTPFGLGILGLGVLFMATVGRRMLPLTENRGERVTGRGELTQVYQLHDRLFSLRIPSESPLDGLSLAETRLGNTLGVKVVSIQRGGHQQMAPDGTSRIHAGDVLFVHGQAAELERLLRLQGMEIQETHLAHLPAAVSDVGGLLIPVGTDSGLVGSTLRELRFRDQWGLVVIALRRSGKYHRTHLASEVLAVGDEIYALGTEAAAKSAAGPLGGRILADALSVLEELQNELFLLQVPAGSLLVGKTVGGSRLGESVGLTVAGLIRDGETRFGVPPTERLHAGDRLLIVAEPSTVKALLEIGQIQLDHGEKASLESEDFGMVEVVVAPRSTAVSRTLAQLDFRSRHGLLALALWREGRPMHQDVANLPLQVGDALLLHGPRERIRHLASGFDFVVLSQVDQQPKRVGKAPHAVACLLLMVSLVVAGIQPIHVAAFTAASLAVLSGALTMQRAYTAIEWRVIFLVAAVLPIGLAMERTGAASLMAHWVTNSTSALGNHATLAVLIVLASGLSQGLDGAPTVVLLAPVVLQTAEGLGASPYPFMMGIALASSAAFMTPFSHKANLLVMGAGGYRSMDYFKVGTPLTILLFLLLVPLIPLFFPF